MKNVTLQKIILQYFAGTSAAGRPYFYITLHTKSWIMTQLFFAKLLYSLFNLISYLMKFGNVELVNV